METTGMSISGMRDTGRLVVVASPVSSNARKDIITAMGRFMRKLTMTCFLVPLVPLVPMVSVVPVVPMVLLVHFVFLVATILDAFEL